MATHKHLLTPVFVLKGTKHACGTLTDKSPMINKDFKIKVAFVLMEVPVIELWVIGVDGKQFYLLSPLFGPYF